MEIQILTLIFTKTIPVISHEEQNSWSQNILLNHYESSSLDKNIEI